VVRRWPPAAKRAAETASTDCQATTHHKDARTVVVAETKPENDTADAVDGSTVESQLDNITQQIIDLRSAGTRRPEG
jgi:hypothetical protein